MCVVFYRTNDVFVAEEKLQSIGIDTRIVPTPVQDRAYCGVCVRIHDSDSENARVILENMDYQTF